MEIFLKLGMVLVVSAIGISAAIAATNESSTKEDSTRIPTLQLVQSIESSLVLPKGAHALSAYVRYYSLQMINRSQLVVATFVFDGSAGRIEYVDSDHLPRIMDGGCDVIEMRYSVKKKKIVTLFCHGVG